MQIFTMIKSGTGGRIAVKGLMGVACSVGVSMLACAADSDTSAINLWPDQWTRHYTSSRARPGLQLPQLGDDTTALLPAGKAEKLGKKALAQITARHRPVKDPLWQAYLLHLGSHLISHTRFPETSIEWVLLNDDAVNAFALPGNIIGVYAGLVLATRNEGELASVLAHEIAHITQHHHSRMLAHYQNSVVSRLAGSLAAAALSTVHGRAGSALMRANNAGHAQAMIGYSRAHEYEADWLAIETLTASGYAGDNMSHFFARQPRNRLHKAFGSLFTHPFPDIRIAETRGRYASTGAALQGGDQQVLGRLEYSLMQVRLRLLVERDTDQALEDIQARSWPGVDREFLNEYATVLAEQLRGQPDKKTGVQLQALLQQQPDSMVVGYSYVMALIESEQLDKAEQSLKHVARQHFRTLPVRLLYARLYEAQHNYVKARQVWRRVIREHPDYFNAYKKMAENAYHENRPALSHLYMARYYHALGMATRARAQLDIAAHAASADQYYLSQIRQLRARWFDEG